MPSARTGPSARPRTSPRRDAAWALEVFCEQLLDRADLERLIGDHVLELSIFVFKRAQLLDVGHAHPGEFVAPGIERVRMDAVFAAQLVRLRARLCFLQDRYDLLVRVLPSSCH